MRYLLLLLFTLLCFTVVCQGPVEVDHTVEGFSKSRLDRLNARMHQYVDNVQIAGVQTAIMRNGELIHSDTYGLSDIEEKKDLEDNSIWRIYSMTKPIVSVGLMMLYEQGKFDLNDPVEDYIPAFKNLQVYDAERKMVVPAKHKITIVDLLTHTSGLGYGWGPNTYVDSIYNSVDKWNMKSTKEFTEWVAGQPLYFEPGTAWRYSVATDVCGHLIEVLSGQLLDEYLEEHILLPLKMYDTSFEVPEDKVDRLVTNYTMTKTGDLAVIDHPKKSRFTSTVTHFSGGGGLLSTTKDYLRFCQMLLNGGRLNGVQILSQKTIQLMTRDHSTEVSHGGGPIDLPGHGNGFGLGFSMITDLAATRALGSEGAYGWGGAAGTYFRIDPKENMIYIMMMQLMPYDHLQARETFQIMVYQALVEE